MAIINNIENIASVTYDGQQINSLPVNTILLLPPLIVKAVDKPVASIGEVLTYTITITNVGLNAIPNLEFSDALSSGVEFVEDSFTLNGSPASETLTDNVITFTIPNIVALGVAVITFQVEIVGGEE